MRTFSRGTALAFCLVAAFPALFPPPLVAQEDYEPDFRRSPSSGPRGTRVFLSGDCRAGGPGSSVEVFIQRVADKRGVAATDYAVAGNGNWSGIISIPKTDLKGEGVTPGDYSIQADCEFDNDPDAEFSFADQSFNVRPGDNPDCGASGCDNVPTEVDCVKDPATCERLATQLPGGEAGRTASGAPLPVRVGAGASPGGFTGGPRTAAVPGQPGQAPGSPQAGPASDVPLIELRAAAPSPSSVPDALRARSRTSPGKGRPSPIQMWAGVLLLTTAAASSAYLLWMRRTKGA